MRARKVGLLIPVPVSAPVSFRVERGILGFKYKIPRCARDDKWRSCFQGRPHAALGHQQMYENSHDYQVILLWCHSEWNEES